MHLLDKDDAEIGGDELLLIFRVQLKISCLVVSHSGNHRDVSVECFLADMNISFGWKVGQNRGYISEKHIKAADWLISGLITQEKLA